MKNASVSFSVSMLMMYTALNSIKGKNKRIPFLVIPFLINIEINNHTKKMTRVYFVTTRKNGMSAILEIIFDISIRIKITVPNKSNFKILFIFTPREYFNLNTDNLEIIIKIRGG